MDFRQKPSLCRVSWSAKTARFVCDEAVRLSAQAFRPNFGTLWWTLHTIHGLRIGAGGVQQ